MGTNNRVNYRVSASRLRRLKEAQIQEQNQKQEQMLRDNEEAKRQSQETINTLTSETALCYQRMLAPKTDLLTLPEKLNELRSEQELLDDVADMAYPVSEQTPDNEAVSAVVDNVLKISYYALPIADAFLVYFALMPIVQGKFYSLFGSNAVFAGAIGAAILALILSWFTRFCAAGLSSESKGTLNYYLLWGFTALSIIVLPSIYIVDYKAFEGEHGLVYTIAFFLISTAVQAANVLLFNKQMEAKSRPMSNKPDNEKARIEHEQYLAASIRETEDRLRSCVDRFRQGYEDFQTAFMRLVYQYTEHRRMYNEDALINLDQLIINMGNLQFYHYEAIPLKRDDSGAIQYYQPVAFPGVKGSENLGENNDYAFISMMLNGLGIANSLDETVKNARNFIMLPSDPAAEQQPGTLVETPAGTGAEPGEDRPEDLPEDQSEDEDEGSFAIWE